MYTIYHGSNMEVVNPYILKNGFYKDFGFGFYCTSYKEQATRWALTRKGASVLNIYIYNPEPSLKVQRFAEMSEEWLDFIVACRRGVSHVYDIVEGPMADDQIWNYAESFVTGKISRPAFWELVRFKHPTHQIAFCTQRALATLIYRECIVL